MPSLTRNTVTQTKHTKKAETNIESHSHHRKHLACPMPQSPTQRPTSITLVKVGELSDENAKMMLVVVVVVVVGGGGGWVGLDCCSILTAHHHHHNHHHHHHHQLILYLKHKKSHLVTVLCDSRARICYLVYSVDFSFNGL